MSEQRIISQANLVSFAGDSVLPPAKAQRRAAVFRETFFAACRRGVLGTAWVLRPRRLRNLPLLARMWIDDVLGGSGRLPDPGTIPADRELAGIARDLAAPTLMAAYRRGFFPHGHIGRPKWMLPAMRCVLELKDFRVPSRLRTIMRRTGYRVTFDEDFEAVIKACAAPRAGKWRLTWITPQIMHVYAPSL